MSVSIRACPHCHSLVLGDSVACPHCRHVLDPRRTGQLVTLIPNEEIAYEEVERQCPQCLEMVKEGLVRCWSCGSFMYPELEEAYRQMQASPSPVIYSLPEDLERPEAQPLMVDPVISTASPVSGGTDDDFELAPGMAAPEFAGTPADDTGYELQQPAAAAQEQVWADEQQRAWAEYYAQHGYTWDPNQAAAAAAADEQSGYDAAAWQAYYAQYGYTMPEGAAPAEAAAPSAAESAAVAPGASAAAADEGAGADEVPHSVATGGEALLSAAMAEEREARSGRRKSSMTGIVVYCPNGHRIKVQERHRGRAGRCPQCRTIFFVPTLDEPQPTAAAGESTAAAPAGRIASWILDLRLHNVNPTRLKLKPGSLLGDYDTADAGFGSSELVVATVFKGNVPFRGMQEPKKKAAARTALYDYLATDKPLDKAPCPRIQVVTAADVAQLKIVQPFSLGEESLFAGVPVFGEGRIAVRLPGAANAAERQYLSMSLSEFRQFAAGLQRVFGIENFGQDLGIPLQDVISELKCHFNETPIPALEQVEYYLADPALTPVIVGRRCQSCGLVISEDARKKEKIGGPSGSTIAKAKCPKCQQKFGNQPLYGLPQPAAAATV